MADAPRCFALLDDCDASPADRRSRLYTQYVRTLTCSCAGELPSFLAALQQAQEEGLHAVALLSYETGANLHGIGPHDAGQESRMPSQVLLFRAMQRLCAEEVAQWLAEQTGSGEADAASPASGIAAARASIDDQTFATTVARIRQYIEAGDTYQVNFTFKLHFAAYGSVQALYRRLRERQPVPYGALIGLPDGGAVLSLSPELFIRHCRGTLTAMPMKGTAAAAGNAEEDRAAASALASDEKNRAENLMIVDLLRNDLGRIAVNGSVTVPALFEVTRYSTVLQMTSTIQATLRPDAALYDIVEALYPCGSITGAPKRRTMQIVRETEPAPRGWYTGAIGWFDAPEAGRMIGDFCLSVPIRTLVLDPAGADGLRRGEMGVGSGIVHDSVAASEYAECLLKTRFLTGLQPQFGLFETLRVTRHGDCELLEAHLERLHASAAFFGFAWDEPMLRRRLADALDALGESASGVWRLRLALSPAGTIDITTAPLEMMATPVKLFLAPARTCSTDVFLRHKTTVRTRYDDAWRTAERHGGFDMLFANERGELTEGGRSNLFVKRKGRWTTPPLAAGVLPGIMRAAILADAAWNATEGILRPEDLADAEAIMVCNALRGALPACIERTPGFAGPQTD